MRIKVLNFLLIVAITGAAFYSCKKTTSQMLRDQEAEYIKKYSEKYMQGDTVTASGLHYLETKAGNDTTNAIKTGDLVKVFYTGYLIQDTIGEGIKKGEMFDTSGDHEPFSFVVGAGTVITGWDEAIRLMKDGGEATWLIPSRLAYSAQPQNGIPAYSPLVFDVRVYRVYRAGDEFDVISKKPINPF